MNRMDAIYESSGKSTSTNCLFWDNNFNGSSNAFGVVNFGGGTDIVHSCTFADNTGFGTDNGVYNRSDSCIITNTLFFNNTGDDILRERRNCCS